MGKEPLPSNARKGQDGGANATTNKGSVAANGAGTIDAQHGNGSTSIDAGGNASASASRNPQ